MYQGIVIATVSGVFEDLKFKISEGSDQNIKIYEITINNTSPRILIKPAFQGS